MMQKLEPIHTSAPDNYIPPGQHDINRAAEKVKLQQYDSLFLLDLAQRSAGGKVRDESEWRGVATQEVLEKGIPRRHVPAFKEAVNEQLKYHNNVCDFIENLDLSRQPGNSPLTQAANVLKVLSANQPPPPEGGGGEGDPSPQLPIFFEQDGKELAEKFNDAADMAPQMLEAEMEMLGADEGQDEGEGAKMVGTINQLLDQDLTDLLKVSRNLNEISNFQARKVVDKVLDREGTDVRNRNVQSFDEMSRVRRTEWAYPKLMRHVRVIRQSAQLRERVKPVTYRQHVYMVVDGSGSMRSDDRIQQATAVLLNRLMGVISEDVDLYYSWFSDYLQEEYHIDTPEKAKEALKMIRTNGFSGGGTRINRSVATAMERIEQMDLVHKPEIIVVSDGDDRISPFPQKGIKVHAFIVGRGSNDGLFTAARASGGVAHRLQAVYHKARRGRTHEGSGAPRR